MTEITTRELNTKLGHLLKAGREAANLTQRQVATQLGYTSPQYVSNWERGRVAPPLNKLAKVVTIINVSSTKVQELLINHATQQIKANFVIKKAKKGKH